MKKLLNTRIRDMKAITLIALVITIVVLIILAAVAINLSIGNNGIFNRVNVATKVYTNQQSSEEMAIDRYGNQIDLMVNRGQGDSKNFIYETIYDAASEGKSTIKTSGQIYNLDKSILDYRFIIVYGRNVDMNHCTSVIVDQSNYQIGSNSETHILSVQAYDTYRSYLYFCFPTDKTIKVYGKGNSGWSETEIYLIKGIS